MKLSEQADILIKHAMSCDELTPQLRDQIEAFVRQSPEHAKLLAEFSLLDQMLASLERENDASAVFAMLLEAEEAAEPIIVDLSARQQRLTGSSHQGKDSDRITFKQVRSSIAYLLGKTLTSAPAYKAYAIAAAVLVAATLFLIFRGDDNTTTDPMAGQLPGQDVPTSPQSYAAVPIVATLTAEHDAVWSRRPGEELYAGQQLTLKQGFAEITTAAGAVAILEAPVTFELTDNDNALRLHGGKLVGLCHAESSKGFVVHTEHADITDLGTEFGVEVRNDGLEAAVFVGEVRVAMPSGNAQAITMNRVARIGYAEGQSYLVVEDEITQAYTRRIPRSRLVTDASLNLPGFEVNVLPQSVYEDVTLYTDRDFQLNGKEESGLPAVLIGGDVIQMPASARPDRDLQAGDRLELEIDVSAPTDIYLLVAVGTKLEPWVPQQYVKTRMQVGCDHGRTPAGTRLGVGPGISIDRVLDVWQRREPVTGRTVIGGQMSGSMYAIIAVPAAETRHNNTVNDNSGL